jgi:hypothetical protein
MSFWWRYVREKATLSDPRSYGALRKEIEQEI